VKTSTLLDLNAGTFADFGQILSTTSAESNAKNDEYTYWGKVGKISVGEKASSGILLCHDRKPIVKSFERHERTPEVLVALDGDSVLCLARPGDRPTGPQWFKVKKGDAIALHPGTWHWIPFPLGGRACSFLVIFAWGTEENDLQYADLEQPISIVV
jgi:ureidoglycolate hydrolase